MQRSFGTRINKYTVIYLKHVGIYTGGTAYNGSGGSTGGPGGRPPYFWTKLRFEGRKIFLTLPLPLSEGLDPPLYGEALPQKGTFFSIKVHERVGILLVEVYVTLVSKKAQKGFQMNIMGDCILKTVHLGQLKGMQSFD